MEKENVKTDGVELKGDDVGEMGRMVMINCSFDPNNPQAKLLGDDQRFEIVKQQAPSTFMEYCKYHGMRPREKDSGGNQVPHYELKKISRDQYVLVSFVVPDKGWAMHHVDATKNRMSLDQK